MSDHPYKHLPDQAFWKRSVANVPVEDVDPVGRFDIRIEQDTKVATAGSCFAQHIARHLQKAGFNYYVTEPGHPVIPQPIRDANNYGLFSARYGNIYTARQLLQLMLRAYGRFNPEDDCWMEADGRVLDPFRPTTQPSGYISEAEMRADRAQHLAAVRTMFETLEVFVFTLGLTECWRSRGDGAVYPLCPGVDGGRFESERYAFYNQSIGDVVSDMDMFIAALKEINPSAKIILTVSPVPLMATGLTDRHVLTSTTYSKSVLRVAAETICRQHDDVHYFPSYEIITGSFNRGNYFASDLRNVTEEGVQHVMRLFLKHAANHTEASVLKVLDISKEDKNSQKPMDFVEAECDEIKLDM